MKRGLDVDQFGARLSFFFNVHNDFLEEIAKFRAARRMWAAIMRERFGSREPRAQMLRFHAQTAGSSLTAQQPDNNIVRTAVQALAAVLGGCQSLHTNAKDEALALPTEESARLALRTQQVIGYESGVTDTIDPLAGSYAIEALTSELERRAREYLARIDAMGGAVAAIENGFMQREIQAAAYRYQQEIERKERIIVGVNEFTSTAAEVPPTLLRIDPALEERQKTRLRALRARRDAGRVAAAVARVEATARGTDNLIPAILDAVRAYATLGEISDAMRGVFGEHRPSVSL